MFFKDGEHVSLAIPSYVLNFRQAGANSMSHGILSKSHIDPTSGVPTFA